MRRFSTEQAKEFYESRRRDWESLEALLKKCHRYVSLSPEQVDTLGRLYRAATSDLALAQRDFPDHQVTRYLNQLVARTHAAIYRSEPVAWRKIRRFFTHDFPHTYRTSLPYIWVAALLLIVPGLAGFVSTLIYPDSAYVLLPAETQYLIPMIENQELWTDIPVSERPYASAFIMQNNIQVTFMAFGGGVLVGLLTVWVMVLNGFLLGGITGLTTHYGIGFDLWTFVIGHGVVELSVITIAGGSGLMLGWAILRPGLLRRTDALRLAARRAVRLLGGCVPLLVAAGMIEGFISPAEFLPWPVKWGVGLLSGLLLYAYLFFSGREEGPALPS